MRFPDIDQLNLPCVFEQLAPGQLHADGRRYLPLVVLGLNDPNSIRQLAVVDRHHVVDPLLEGRAGAARLVFLLSQVRLIDGPRHGLVDAQPGQPRASTMPGAYGRVVSVPTWEAEREHLPYEALYLELVVDIGIGTIGVRTSTTASNLADHIGAARIGPGDWVEVTRSRIDILGFRASDTIS
jgi:hypothetical protein